MVRRVGGNLLVDGFQRGTETGEVGVAGDRECHAVRTELGDSIRVLGSGGCQCVVDCGARCVAERGLLNAAELLPSPFASGRGAPQTDDIELRESAEHLGRWTSFEHGALELLTVDQQWCQQWFEGRDAHSVESARSHPCEVGLTGLDIFDRPDLKIRLASSPQVRELDPQRAVRPRGHLVGPGDELSGSRDRLRSGVERSLMS